MSDQRWFGEAQSAHDPEFEERTHAAPAPEDGAGAGVSAYRLRTPPVEVYRLRHDLGLNEDQNVAILCGYDELLFAARFTSRSDVWHDQSWARAAAGKCRMLVAAFGERRARHA